MSTAPAKRRKLDHDNSMDFDSDSSSDHGESSAEDAPATKAAPSRSQLKSGHSKNDDESAVYAGGLFKSSMFKYQVDYLLEEVRPKYEKRFEKAVETLNSLKGWIEAIEPRAPLNVAEASKTLQKEHKISVPFPSPKPDKNLAYKFAYEKPSSINVVGSYPLKTMTKSSEIGSSLAIDMLVVMPKSLFQDKDYLNYRYFYKRAYFLASLAAGLQEHTQENYTLKFEYLNGNDLHPILVVKPNPSGDSKLHAHYEIHLIPGTPQGLFPNSKLCPSKNCVRPKDSTENNLSLPSTPFYNASLSSEGSFGPYLKLLYSASKQSDGFKDAAMLGRVWLRRRGIGSAISQGGFGNFEWAALMALLLKGGGPKGHSILSPGYSSYQMFKAMLQFLSTNDMAAKPFIYEAPEISISSSSTPVFYDGPRGQSLLYKMTPWSYALLQEEARVSLEMLSNEAFDQFDSTFVVKASEATQRYDCVIRLPVPATSFEESSCDHTSHTTSFSHRVFSVLREGLMDRVKLIHIKTPFVGPWSLKSSGVGLDPHLLVSFVFDPANVDRLVDHGPSAEEKKKAAKFQKFWGEKAELRRFKDGSILESLIWKAGSTYSIFADIVTYLLKHHFGSLVSEDIIFLGEAFVKAVPSSETSMKTFKSLKEAFHTFEKDVRDLECLPLQLRQLSPADSQLRFASLCSPEFSPQRPLARPADVLIQFEGSGRWPDDLVAIQRTKIAFLLKIGVELTEANDAIETRVGLENEDKKFQNCAFLDVRYESGAVFRLRIHNEREQTLLERFVKDKFTDSRTRERAVLALSIYKRTCLQLPVLTQSISTHCTRYPLLSPTIRLMKLWFESHMLQGHASGELIELLVARTFLQPYPWRAPSSVMTGFLRTLMFIERWDWRHEPLIVDFTGTMTSKDVASANTRLEAWRKIDPGMNRTVIFAVSNHDASGVAFTDQGPSKVVAARMTSLASSAYKLVKEKGLELDQRSLFASSTADYNFVIHISPKFIKQQKRKDPSKSKFKNLEVQLEVDLENVGFEPVQLYLSELKKLYTDNIVFFHNSASELHVGGLWNPQPLAPRSFKTNLAYATKVTNSEQDGEDASVMIDKDAILAEIARLGGDMVSKIERHR
ncbi:pre-rRNA processing protein-like protein Utp22, partial [Amylocarpus encephaloides]